MAIHDEVVMPVQTRLRRLTLATAVICFVVIVCLNWPGHLSYDSVIQLSDGRAGAYHIWHPPVMAWLLGLGDRLIRGAGLYMAFQIALGAVGFCSLIYGPRPLAKLAPIVPLITAALPLLCLWQGIVWKDVLFANSMVAGFSLLFAAAAAPSARGFQVRAGAAFACLVLATLARQNGAIALVVGGAAFGFVLVSRVAPPNRQALWKAALTAAAVSALCLGLSVAINRALGAHAVDAGASEAQLHMLEAYDVVGAIAHQPDLPLPELAAPTDATMRGAAKTLYTPRRNDALLKSPFNEFAAQHADEIEDQWFDTVLHHPKPWLEHRAEVFGWHLSSNASVCYADTTGVDGAPALVRALGMTIHQSPRDLALESYASVFHDTPFYSHLFYAGIALLLAVVFFRSTYPAERVLGLMLVSALLFAASFTVIGVACDYRYLYALDLSTIAASFYWLLRIDLSASLIKRGLRSSTEPVR